LIIVCLVTGFSSRGGATIVLAAMMATTRQGFEGFGLLSCKTDSSINFVAAILANEISYLIA
jgi:cobalamin biosynthesis protein CobD/CbiB